MNILNSIFGINYRTSILGVGVIVAAVGRLGMAYKAQDFAALANDGQLIMETLAALLMGFGLVIAKDNKVTGVGAVARAVDSEGALTNVEGQPAGQQTTHVPPPVPPSRF